MDKIHLNVQMFRYRFKKVIHFEVKGFVSLIINNMKTQIKYGHTWAHFTTPSQMARKLVIDVTG